ncbi:serine protease [Nocardioides baekrokdamisoli]|uniref:Serine protease n=1 Tax=Nocardioides baekrokdamisoli TaxID=1804624 RepID=A0A3G9IE64_9ACTN|nr:S53 family peptidase [Nocardioides baekrokdamisoli]BBH17260.1 serine protease [Nocardioides baekrokdamisoli]
MAATPSQAAPGPHQLPGSSPGWLAHAHRVGTPAANAAVNARVYLAPNGGFSALQSFAQSVSTPGSANYGRYLTPAQYHAQFDASPATIAAVKQWLTSAGFKVTGTEAQARYVEISGTVAAAQQAFGASIGTFTHDDITVQAPTGPLSVPGGLASAVLSISGVDTTPEVNAPATTKPSPPPAGFRNGKPCSAAYGDSSSATGPDGTALPKYNGTTLPFAVCGYTGKQLRTAYEAGVHGLTGRGVTVAIVDAYASPTILADANQYAISTGDKAFRRGQFSQNLPASYTHVGSGKHGCTANGWYGEETLDVEAAHAMAPDANVRYYGGKSCSDPDLLAALARVNDEGIATIVSNSWGGVGDVVKPSLFQAYEATFLQAAAEGISYTFSSGDSGDESTNLGTPQTDYPASDPYVTAVGGTSTQITSAGITGETGWQTSKYSLVNGAWSLVAPFQYGGGGGYSSNIPEPAYQTAAGIVSPNGGRAVPDISMDADPTTGMLVGQTQAFPDGGYYDTYRIGGTSLASPLFAGMTALKIQSSGHGLGLLNNLIYTDHSGFTDVTGAGMDAGNIRVDYANGLDPSGGYLYSIRTFNGATTSLKVGAGWDSETGWGSPRSGWVQ